MKLLSTLKDVIILETKKGQDGITIFSKLVDNKLIELKSTYHQRRERFGVETYDKIVDKYQDYLAFRRSKFQQPPRLAVPDSMIKEFFSKNVDRIYNVFNEENPENGKLIFVHKRFDNEDDKFFDYIEVLLKKEGNFFYIITSAFSSDGKFLKTKDTEKRSKKVTLEQKTHNLIKVIYI